MTLCVPILVAPTGAIKDVLVSCDVLAFASTAVECVKVPSLAADEDETSTSLSVDDVCTASALSLSTTADCC